jgi:hypothetical protein
MLLRLRLKQAMGQTLKHRQMKVKRALMQKPPMPRKDPATESLPRVLNMSKTLRSMELHRAQCCL